MKPKRVLPYYHPTSVCLIDDNASYLDSLSLHIPDDWPFKTFHSPFDALDYLNNPQRPRALAQRCFTAQGGQFGVDLSQLELEVSRTDRFEDVALAVVDYAMPSMNGLEMCANLIDDNLRIVLLTGVADEALAVEAFNAGLIHRFIRKAVIEEWGSLFAEISQMRTDYFYKSCASLIAGLESMPGHFTHNPNFADYFDSLCAELNIAEYYLVTNPAGYLMITREGKAYRLVAATPSDLEQQVRLCDQFNAPEKYRQGLVSGQLLAYFFDDAADMTFEKIDWPDHFAESQAVPGGLPLKVAIFSNPPLDIDFDQTSSTLQAFMQKV